MNRKGIARINSLAYYIINSKLYRLFMTIPEMLAVLFSYGMSQTAIAEKVGVSQPTIYRASRGSSLSYRAGKKVEELYLEMKKKAESFSSLPTPECAGVAG